MSFFSALASFGSKVEHAFINIWKHEPQVVSIIGKSVQVIAPEVIAIVGLINPVAGTLVANVVDRIKTGVAAVSAASADFNKSGSVGGFLEALKADIPELLDAIRIENPEHVANAEKYTTVIATEIEALLAALPSVIAKP